MLRLQWRNLIGWALVAALPLAGSWARRQAGDGCALDGVPIESRYRVRIVAAPGPSHEFCCIRCAQAWQQHGAGSAASVFVTDEASGEEVAASQATYVRSTVITTPTSGNRVHTFARPEDAERHAETCHGTVLPDQARPFESRPNE